VFADRAVSRDLMGQAADQGYEALVVTVDLPVMGVRERDLRSGVRSANAEAVSSAAAAQAQGTMTPADFAGLIDPELSWRDVERFASESPLPVILKGILTPEDARLAAEHGAAGIIVSNHGGRQLDTVLSGADALTPIVEEVGDRIEVMVDGGVRRGTDVLKALALGARAVLLGRPALWGLAVDGAAGAARVLQILLAELDAALALSGAGQAQNLDPSYVSRAPWSPAKL
jgi:4-hydroxymandelate oxidase